MKSVLSSFCYFMAVVALSAAYQVSNNVSDKTESGLLNYLLSLPTAPTLVFCGAVFILIATYLLPNRWNRVTQNIGLLILHMRYRY